jgi:hypothetical protein
VGGLKRDELGKLRFRNQTILWKDVSTQSMNAELATVSMVELTNSFSVSSFE